MSGARYEVHDLVDGAWRIVCASDLYSVVNDIAVLLSDLRSTKGVRVVDRSLDPSCQDREVWRLTKNGDYPIDHAAWDAAQEREP